MYTDKQNILQLVTLLREHGIHKVVVCPGSRNIPIVQTLANMPEITCYPITDERSAGFFAMGLALHGGAPAAVCCTSGTALLNLHPAVAEAFYQQVPLVVISADRPRAWIGQMDGQTLPQPGVFGSLVKKSVDLPEIATPEDECFCNRLINEALLELNHHGKGPVHINVPVSEPFFKLPVNELPAVRKIVRYCGLNPYDKDYSPLIERLNRYRRRMAVAGQMNLIYLFDRTCARILSRHFVWFCEHTANRTLPGWAIRNIDPLLCTMDNKAQEDMKPELLITYGGHIISKRLKNFLRRHPPVEHWHISPDGSVADLFGSLTTVIEMDPFEFWEKIAPQMEGSAPEYPRSWEARSKAVPSASFAYSEQGAIGCLLEHLPTPCTLHLANSSAVRYAQLFKLPENVEVLANRGTNGIEGSMSTALGYAAASPQLNFLIIGDLSFFYDMNALWNVNYGSNIRILLLNNSGGEIFHALPGLELQGDAKRYVTATHTTTAKAWAEDRGFDYTAVHNEAELQEAIPAFVAPSLSAHPQLMEVFTDKDSDVELLKTYYHNLKQL